MIAFAATLAQLTTPAPYYVAAFYNVLNTSYYRVTPLADGMERVEHIGREHADRLRVEALTLHAEGIARATGSSSASYTANGETVTWHRNAHALRIVEGTHRARLTLDDAQAALKAEMAQNPERPAKGDRYIVSELSGYQLIQNRPLDHRSCDCGNGVTTYSAGTVESVTYWMDNSVDVNVVLESGRKVSVQTTAPHGDICF